MCVDQWYWRGQLAWPPCVRSAAMADTECLQLPQVLEIRNLIAPPGNFGIDRWLTKGWKSTGNLFSWICRHPAGVEPIIFLLFLKSSVVTIRFAVTVTVPQRNGLSVATGSCSLSVLLLGLTLHRVDESIASARYRYTPCSAHCVPSTPLPRYFDVNALQMIPRGVDTITVHWAGNHRSTFRHFESATVKCTCTNHIGMTNTVDRWRGSERKYWGEGAGSQYLGSWLPLSVFLISDYSMYQCQCQPENLVDPRWSRMMPLHCGA